MEDTLLLALLSILLQVRKGEIFFPEINKVMSCQGKCLPGG